MKKPGDRDESVFNSPAEAGARFAYIGCLVGMTGGLCALLIGAFTGRAGPAIAGVGLLAGSWAARIWLKRRGQLAGLDRSLDEVARGEVATGAEPHVEHLMSLLKQWDDLEHKRGSPEFDPWAVQAVRHDIRAAIEQNPDLERLFHT